MVAVPHAAGAVPPVWSRAGGHSATILFRRMMSANRALSFFRTTANSSGVSKIGISARASSFSLNAGRFHRLHDLGAQRAGRSPAACPRAQDAERGIGLDYGIAGLGERRSRPAAGRCGATRRAPAPGRSGCAAAAPGDLGDHERDLAADQAPARLARALVGHVHEARAGRLLDHLHRDDCRCCPLRRCRRSACPARACRAPPARPASSPAPRGGCSRRWG